jgi:hypothetical protein
LMDALDRMMHRHRRYHMKLFMGWGLVWAGYLLIRHYQGPFTDQEELLLVISAIIATMLIRVGVDLEVLTEAYNRHLDREWCRREGVDFDTFYEDDNGGFPWKLVFPVIGFAMWGSVVVWAVWSAVLTWVSLP